MNLVLDVSNSMAELNKRFQCTSADCKKSFGTKYHLNRHIKSVHDKIKDIECAVVDCEYKCGRQSDLYAHIKRIHDKIKDFECAVIDCEYKCSQQCDLNKHIKICTGKSNQSSMEFNCKIALDELKLEFMYNSTHDSLKGINNGRLRFDFIIPTIDESYFMIEVNGIQHYKSQRFGGRSQDQADEAFRTQVLNDAIKEEYCRKKGYALLWIKYDDPQEYVVIIQEFIELNKIQI